MSSGRRPRGGGREVLEVDVDDARLAMDGDAGAIGQRRALNRSDDGAFENGALVVRGSACTRASTETVMSATSPFCALRWPAGDRNLVPSSEYFIHKPGG